MKKLTVLTFLFLFLLSLVAFGPLSYGGRSNADFPEIMDRCTNSNLNVQEAHGRNAWALKCKDTIRSKKGAQISSLDEKIRFQDARRPNPFYALMTDMSLKRWDAPTSSDKSCENFTVLYAFCESSCFTPETDILYKDGYRQIKEAQRTRQSDIITLKEGSFLDDFMLQVTPVAYYSRSIRKAKEEIRTIETEEGLSLSVTLSHPILLGKDSINGKYKAGSLVKAGDLNLGDYLIKVDGTFQKITSIKDKDFFGRVYNVAPKSESLEENIIVANGFLVGSAKLQYSETFKDITYRQILRELNDVSSLMLAGK